MPQSNHVTYVPVLGAVLGRKQTKLNFQNQLHPNCTFMLFDTNQAILKATHNTLFWGTTSGALEFGFWLGSFFPTRETTFVMNGWTLSN